MRLIRRRWSSLDTPTRLGLIAGIVLAAVTVVADMWWDVDYELAANIALVACVVMVNAFTLLYSVRSPWWTHRLGRVYWAKCVVLVLVLDQIVLAVWWDLDYPGRQIVRFVIYSAGAIVYVPMTVSLVREQSRKLLPPPARSALGDR